MRLGIAAAFGARSCFSFRADVHDLAKGESRIGEHGMGEVHQGKRLIWRVFSDSFAAIVPEELHVDDNGV